MVFTLGAQAMESILSYIISELGGEDLKNRKKENCAFFMCFKKGLLGAGYVDQLAFKSQGGTHLPLQGYGLI